MIRVVVADPSPLLAEALSMALDGEDGVRVVGWATDERGAAALARKHRSEVILSEVELSAGSGLRLAAELAGTAAVVILTRRHEGDVLLAAAEYGAAGCLSHATDPASLVALLDRALHGEFAVDPSRLAAALRSAAGLVRDHRGVVARNLTPRELEIIDLIVDGKSNLDIAARLQVSEHTVRTHVGRVMKKLGVHSRAAIVRLASLHGSQAGARGNVVYVRGPDLTADHA